MSINSTRWRIGWSPRLVVISMLIVGVLLGAMAGDGETAGQLGTVGLVAGTAVWLWGRHEVNSKYVSLLEDFRDSSRKRVERETGGMAVSSAHSFISAKGSSPILIEPARTYSTSHLLFGDTSVVVNRQYEYDVKERTQKKGGSQQEVFYDQISNVQSEDYNNYAELEISLSSGDTERIRGRDTAGINRVKSDLQQKMRDARRGRRRGQDPSAAAGGQRNAGGRGQGHGRGQPDASGSREPTPNAPAGQKTARASAGADSGSKASGSGGSGSGESGAAAAAESESGEVSTDWLADESADATLRVRNDAGEPKSVRVGCRTDGEKRLTDDVRLAPGETADWDDLPDDSRFEIGVVVDGGPSAGERFDPERNSLGEIRVSITGSEVVFGDRADSGPSHGDAGSRAETPSQDGPSATSGGASSAAPQSTEDAASGTVAESSSAANKVFGEFGRSESGGGSGSDDGSKSGGGAETAAEESESWDDAVELASAVQQSPSEARVERLASFLDGSPSTEREAAIRGLRQSVRKYPKPIAAAVPSVASLLDDDGEARQEAIVTLQRLAESHPDAVADATDAVVERLDDENPKVRTAACRTLDEIGATAGAEKLQELADEDEHKGVQVAAFHALQSVEN